jgi:hypothetical protein
MKIMFYKLFHKKNYGLSGRYKATYFHYICFRLFQTTATLESDDVIKFQSTTPKGNLIRTFTFSDEYLVVVSSFAETKSTTLEFTTTTLAL